MAYLGGLAEPEARALVMDWIGANPLTGPHPWHASWHPFSLSIRVVAWLQTWAEQDWAPGPSESAILRASLGTQLRCLARHLELDVRGNHLIKNLKALLWGAACFQGPEARSWGLLGASLLRRELEDQVLSDGMHFELSPSYHLQVLEDLLDCHHVLPPGPDRDRLAERLRHMGAAASLLRHPDGAPSLFADGGLHTARPPATLMEVLPGPAPHLHPSTGPFALEAAGYYGFHAEGEAFIADAGLIAADHLPAHGHGDMYAFEWSVGGHRVIVDTGVVEYREGPRRAHARSTRAHNTVTVGGEDQGEFWSSFRLGRRGRPREVRFSAEGPGLTLKGSHDGYAHLAGRPWPTRTFTAQPGHLRVEDIVNGGAGQRVVAHLLLHPECKVELHPGGAYLSTPGGPVELRSSSPLAVEPAPWWPDMGVEVPTRRILIQYGNAPCQGSFELIHTPSIQESP
jgi:uncharacterized heparinase superfamily protein